MGNNQKALKTQLIFMNFLQFAVWGAYLTCMGAYLGRVGLGDNIGTFYAMQGIVSIFMPALIGTIADRWIPAQRMLGICHLIAGLAMVGCFIYGQSAGENVQFTPLIAMFTVSIGFYMPSLALSYSVAYTGLTNAGLDTVKDFPPIRVWGTVGFIATMWFVDIMDYETMPHQFLTSGVLSICLFFYSFFLPKCSISKSKEKKGIIDALGLKAFSLFKQRNMAIFFLFSMMLGVCLQITNGFAVPFIKSFDGNPEYAGAVALQYPVILSSLSQASETLCILLIPFFMKRFGIKTVMLIAFLAWVLRFALLGFGNPGPEMLSWGFLSWVLSMIVYGVAFDFFNISGSLYVDRCTSASIRSSAQGVFLLMTNGFGATVGSFAAQTVIKANTLDGVVDWTKCWYIFAGYALFVGVLFALLFQEQKSRKEKRLDKKFGYED
ncbi:MAG: MFS transporter [Bacteroidaceae bacterium]|jgi:NHS family nucleoside permease-like MFS transporter|nr:MFS transporter [Bacteroidaceae bacterium]